MKRLNLFVSAALLMSLGLLGCSEELTSSRATDAASDNQEQMGKILERNSFVKGLEFPEDDPTAPEDSSSVPQDPSQLDDGKDDEDGTKIKPKG